MIVTITNLQTGKVTHLDVADEHCDRMLDKFAYEFMPANPDFDRRWERMMQNRAAKAAAAAEQDQPKNRKRR